MRKILIFIFSILFSCGIYKSNKNDCDENEKFKVKFFYHINYIKNNISISQDAKFRESIIFISSEYKKLDTRNGKCTSLKVTV